MSYDNKIIKSCIMYNHVIFFYRRFNNDPALIANIICIIFYACLFTSERYIRMKLVRTSLDCTLQVVSGMLLQQLLTVLRI